MLVVYTTLTLPQHLYFLWAPYKLIFVVIVAVGKFNEFFSLCLTEDSKDKVVEDAVSHIWKLSPDERLLQEEVDQRGLVVRVS